MSNQTTSATAERVITDKVHAIFGNNDNSTINLTQTFNTKGVTKEQFDDVLEIMRQQTETANIHAKIIAKLLNIDI